MRVYSDFIKDSIAECTEQGWTVFIDGEKRVGAINNCQGNTEYEAKEDAWQYYQRLMMNVNFKKMNDLKIMAENYAIINAGHPAKDESSADWEKIFKAVMYGISIAHPQSSTYESPSGEGDAVDGWISLKDRLPKHGQKVDLWLGSYRKEWTWEGQDSENIMISGAKATHWMPAPTPPKSPIK